MSAWLDRLTQGSSLTDDEAGELFALLVDDATHPALAGALLTALSMKGETVDEVRGMARAMRARAVRPDLGDVSRLVDVVGTGGDGSGSFNLSTGSALLAAAAGARVAKHGNNAITSRAGSADLLTALGLRLPLPPTEAKRVLEACGFTFLHAPAHHPALRVLGPVRRALATRTVFNLLGPLCHPAAPPFAVIGACDRRAATLMADALSGLPIERAFVIHGDNGWDEATPIAPFALWDVRPAVVERSTRSVRDYGLTNCAADELRGADASYNAAALRRVFDGEAGAHRDALVLGAALALEVAGLEPTPKAAAARAQRALDSGAARRLLARLTP